MEGVLIIVFVIGIIFLFASLINLMGFRNPNKKGLVKIATIKEKELEKYPFLTILIRKYSRQTYGRSTSKITEKLKVYSVVLLNSTHRKRIKIGGFDNKLEAMNMLTEISEEYNKQIVKYSPQLSERSKNRR